MKGTKVQTLGAFLLCIQQKYHSLQWLFQLACNQKIVFLTSLEVFTTVLAPQNVDTLDELWWDNHNRLVHTQHATHIAI